MGRWDLRAEILRKKIPGSFFQRFALLGLLYKHTYPAWVSKMGSGVSDLVFYVQPWDALNFERKPPDNDPPTAQLSIVDSGTRQRSNSTIRPARIQPPNIGTTPLQHVLRQAKVTIGSPPSAPLQSPQSWHHTSPAGTTVASARTKTPRSNVYSLKSLASHPLQLVLLYYVSLPWIA